MVCRARLGVSLIAIVLLSCDTAKAPENQSAQCAVEFIILGAGQDAGAPQIGNADDPAWKDDSLVNWPTSAALVDHRSGSRYLFEATPKITEQLNLLNNLAPVDDDDLNISGVFITHAHIGHYSGLIYFGREAAGAKNIDVYAMPRMEEYLRLNGPWSQLVGLNNIALSPIEDKIALDLEQGITVTPYLVPHRDEFSETVAYVINTADKAVLFVPDIDSWEEWKSDYNITLEDIVDDVDYAFLDATFYDDNELPGRDMSEIPHPRVTETLALLGSQRGKVYFIHYNHTNPIRFHDTMQTKTVLESGFHIARRKDRFCLLEAK